MKTIKGSLKVREDANTLTREVAELLEKLLAENSLRPADLHAVLLSATDDLPGVFLEEAASELGLDAVSVYTVQQFRYQADMDRCVQMVLYPKALEHEPVDLLLGCESWGSEL